MPHDDEQFDRLPPAIVDALRELDGPAVMPDAGRDADVLSGARRHLAQAGRKRRNLRLFFAGSAGGALAAAAMIGIIVFLGNPFGETERDLEVAYSESVPATTFHGEAGDVDQNGRVDILDAYALARRLERGRSSSEPMDLDGDGKVDQRDIDWIAHRAVMLNHGEPG
ncbi:MAG: dockerin type I domain-containing protein [Phycisphaeraceae bacterium]